MADLEGDFGIEDEEKAVLEWYFIMQFPINYALIFDTVYSLKYFYLGLTLLTYLRNVIFYRSFVTGKLYAKCSRICKS
jgi:hypothetical protein